MKFRIESESQYHEFYKQSLSSPETYWEKIAETFEWKKKWNKRMNQSSDCSTK